MGYRASVIGCKSYGTWKLFLDFSKALKIKKAKKLIFAFLNVLSVFKTKFQTKYLITQYYFFCKAILYY